MTGFGVRVSQGGTKTFIIIHGANRQRESIGRYPVISLKEARNKAKEVQAQITLGRHNQTASTFQDARQAFLDDAATRNKANTVRYYTSRLDRHFKFGRKRLDEITRADVTAKLAKLAKTPGEQNHAFVTIRSFFNWAVREQHIAISPINGMRAVGKRNAREHFLSDQEIAEVFTKAKVHPFPFGPIVQLLLLTGQRRNEIGSLRWEWVDQKERLITLPNDVTKNKRTHVFPYGDLSAAVFEGLPRINEFVFPARTEEAKHFNGWGKCKARLDKDLENVSPFVLHDLRRTFSSTMAKLSTPIHVTEKLLNHVTGTVSGVAAVYNRYTYMDEMRTAIAAYDDYLAKLVADC